MSPVCEANKRNITRTFVFVEVLGVPLTRTLATAKL